GLLLLVVLFAALDSRGIFLTTGNLTNVLEQIAVLAMVAAVQTVVMVVGDFDLSVGSLASLVGVITAQLLVGGTSLSVTILLALLVGLAAGALNGVLVSYLGLSAFIATLATMTSFTGLALLVSNGATVFGLPEGFVAIGQSRLGPVPMPVVIAVVLTLLVWFVLSRTVLGREWYAVGGNSEAARLSGVNTRFVRFTAFLASGFGSALAGVV